MKRVTVILMVLALVLAGAMAVLAQDVPQALQGVNLSAAQVVNDTQAQQIRGTAPNWVGNGPPGLVGPSDDHWSYGFDIAGDQAVTKTDNVQAPYHSRAVVWYVNLP